MSLRFNTSQREQWIPQPIDHVFSFFADAQNLEQITPSWLGFRILSMSSNSITSGTEIRYRLKFHGIPVHWLTEIHRWVPPHLFVDVQKSGPSKLWHHAHRFQSHGEGTRMIDVVRYALPFGIVGRIAHSFGIREDVRQIFDYRRQRIDELFVQKESNAA